MKLKCFQIASKKINFRRLKNFRKNFIRKLFFFRKFNNFRKKFFEAKKLENFNLFIAFFQAPQAVTKKSFCHEFIAKLKSPWKNLHNPTTAWFNRVIYRKIFSNKKPRFNQSFYSETTPNTHPLWSTDTKLSEMIEEEEDIFTSHSWKVRSSRFYFISSLFDWSYTKERNTQSHNIDPFASKHKARTYLGLGTSNFGNILTWQFNLNFKVKEVEKKCERRMLEKSFVATVAITGKGVHKLSEKSHRKFVVGEKNEVILSVF